jgi:hypothetical protein
MIIVLIMQGSIKEIAPIEFRNGIEDLSTIENNKTLKISTG